MDRMRPRINLVRVGGGATLSERANAVLNMAKGRFVAFLCAGDILTEQSLYEVAVELNPIMGASNPNR